MKRVISLFLCLLCLMMYTSYGIAETGAFSGLATIDAGSASKVHLRAEPSTAAASRGLYYTGTDLFYESDPTQEWTKVVIGSQDGYIKSEYLRWGEEANRVQPQQPTGVTHTNSSVNIRSTPSKQGEQVGRLYDGDAVTILGETDTHWYYTVNGDVTGYVMTQYVNMSSDTNASDVIIKDGTQNRNTLDLYKRVVNNHLEFFSVSDNCNKYLGQLIGGFGGQPVMFTQFAVVDLDADNTVEAVVKLTVNGNDYGYEILDNRDGVVYGYDMVYRGFRDLKADGTFSYASGASDAGFGSLILGQSEYSVKPIAYCESTDDGSVNYYHMGSTIAVDAYIRLVDTQDKKKNVTWYDFTELDIERILGQ